MSAEPLLSSAVRLAHNAFRDVLREGDMAVDATLGTGQDCLFLCELVGDTGRVHGFDIQPSALERAGERLRAAGLAHRASLHLLSHERMAEAVPPGIRLAAFNLGWLPGSDKRVTTRVETTLAAVQAALNLLAVHGMAVICVYPGHEEGERERRALLDFAGSLPPRDYTVLWQQFINGGPGAPGCLLIEKIRPSYQAQS